MENVETPYWGQGAVYSTPLIPPESSMMSRMRSRAVQTEYFLDKEGNAFSLLLGPATTVGNGVYFGTVLLAKFCLNMLLFRIITYVKHCFVSLIIPRILGDIRVCETWSAVINFSL